MLFAFFISTGVIATIFGWLFFKLSKKLNNDWPIVACTIFLLIFSILSFSLMGLFYASYTHALTKYMKLWLAIIAVSVFIIYIYIHTVKEYMKLKNKLHSNASYLDLSEITNFSIHNRLNTKTVFSSGHFLVISYIFFLIFNNLADKLSFGLNSYLLSFFK